MLAELLAAITASPEDDQPRRVYADALLETGELQGELIHLQCDLAAGGLARDAAVARRRRERELLQEHAARWTAGLAGLASGPVFRRGFVDEVIVAFDRFASIGDRLFAAAPALRGVMLDGGRIDGNEDPQEAQTYIYSNVNRALACPAFERVRGFAFDNIGYEYRGSDLDENWESLATDVLYTLVSSPTNLDSLDVLDAGESTSVLTRAPLLKQLSRLVIGGDFSKDERSLFDSLSDRSIRSLELIRTNVRKLSDPVISNLTELHVESAYLDFEAPTDKLERFAFTCDQVLDRHIDHALVARNVRELSFDGAQVPGWRRLAHSEAPLCVLRVHGDDVGADEADAILRMPCAAQLEVLQLKSIDDAARARLEQQFGVLVEISDPRRRYVYWR